MNEREKLEMVKMCVDAKLEGKSLQYLSSFSDDWTASRENIAIVAENILADIEYRIAKPTVKVRYRAFKWSDGPDRYNGVGHVTTEEEFTRIQQQPFFRGWIGDWQEVEIEE